MYIYDISALFASWGLGSSLVGFCLFSVLVSLGSILPFYISKHNKNGRHLKQYIRTYLSMYGNLELKVYLNSTIIYPHEKEK